MFIRSPGRIVLIFCFVLFLRQDFMLELTERLFSPEMGLMAVTWEGKLYPNPSSELVAGPNHLDQLEFMGRIIGKALQEAVVVNVPLADFFVSKFLHQRSSIDDLKSFDPQLYKNLMSMKSMSASEVETLTCASRSAK